MIKLQFLFRAPDGCPHAELARWALADLGERLLAQKPRKLMVTLTTTAPPRLSMFPFKKRGIVLASIWDEEDRREMWAEEARRELVRPGAIVEGYEVEESIPVESLRTWAEGRRTPGAGLLTLLRRPAGLGDDEFFDRWFNGHTPHSLRTHPLWRYVRNVVQKPLIAGSTNFDGIVEEHFREAKDMLDPLRFYGGPWEEHRSRRRMAKRLLPGMISTGLDIKGFIDLKSIETYLVDEYRLSDE